MKLITTIASIVLLLSLSASEAAPPAPSFINIAHRLYVGCIQASFYSAAVIPTRDGITEFLKDVDHECVMWMAIWYQPLTGDAIGIEDWDESSMTKLELLRRKTLIDLDKELRTALDIK